MENKFVNRKLEKKGVVGPCHERLWVSIASVCLDFVFSCGLRFCSGTSMCS